ncbi:hypothetical protein [Janibacter sp. UYMM211]|uniref:hypothetical protein n=1 Tax=Janibacter sp. UYMM211 TaxID=3156342 RepID=UPI00339B6431
MFTNRSNRQIAELSRENAEREREFTQLEAEQARLYGSRERVYALVMQWIVQSSHQLVPWRMALREGSPRNNIELPGTSIGIPIETLAQIYTFGSNETIDAVARASRDVDEAILMLNQLKWIVPPQLHGRAVETLKTASMSLARAREVVRSDLGSSRSARGVDPSS